MELEKVIQEKVNALVSAGAVDKMIETHLSKSIDSVIGELLQSYSDFGKQLKAAIGTKMELNLTHLNIDSYSTMICQVIENTMNGTVLESSRAKIQKHITEVLQVIEKKHWLLSELVQKYRESLHGESTTVDLEYKEETYGNYVQLGERGSFTSGRNKVHDITIHLSKSEKNKVFAITDHGRHVSPLTGNPNRWEVFMMQLWANECTIEIDIDRAEAVANREEDF